MCSFLVRYSSNYEGELVLFLLNYYVGSWKKLRIHFTLILTLKSTLKVIIPPEGKHFERTAHFLGFLALSWISADVSKFLSVSKKNLSG